MKLKGEWSRRAAAVAIAAACAHAAVAQGVGGNAQEESVPPTMQPAIAMAPAIISPLPSVASSAPEIEASEVECVAKVVRHAAANQPADGQLAVAQVVRTRMKD